MIGSYYGNDHDAAIQGMGDAQGFAIETLLSILRARRPGVMHETQPSGVFSVWAQQVGDIDWKVTGASSELVVYPITNAMVQHVDKASYGHPLPWVAVMTNAPRKPGVVEAAFDASKYELFETEGVYSQADGRPVPRIYFMYWAKLREGTEGGRESLDLVAKRLGGKLVFPMEIPASNARPRPAIAFEVALAAQQDVGVAQPSELGAVTAVSGLGAIERNTAIGVSLAIVGVAGWIFYKTVRP